MAAAKKGDRVVYRKDAKRICEITKIQRMDGTQYYTLTNVSTGKVTRIKASTFRTDWSPVEEPATPIKAKPKPKPKAPPSKPKVRKDFDDHVFMSGTTTTGGNYGNVTSTSSSGTSNVSFTGGSTTAQVYGSPQPSASAPVKETPVWRSREFLRQAGIGLLLVVGITLVLYWVLGPQ